MNRQQSGHPAESAPGLGSGCHKMTTGTFVPPPLKNAEKVIFEEIKKQLE